MVNDYIIWYSIWTVKDDCRWNKLKHKMSFTKADESVDVWWEIDAGEIFS